jgi:hypothetical protein
VLESAKFQEDEIEHTKLQYDQRRLP